MQFDNSKQNVNDTRDLAKSFSAVPMLPTNERGFGKARYVMSLVDVQFYEANERSDARVEFFLRMHDSVAPNSVYRVVNWVQPDVATEEDGTPISDENGAFERMQGQYAQFVTKMNSMMMHMGLPPVVWQSSEELVKALMQGKDKKIVAEIRTKTVLYRGNEVQNHTLGFVAKLG